MEQNTSRFNPDLDFDFNDFDPLESLSVDEDDAVPSEEETLDCEADSPADASAGVEDERSPEERIAELLATMEPRRKVLLGVLSFCAEPKLVDEVNAHIDELQKNNCSAYTAANLCALLEKAGAIERVTEEGELFKDIELEPQVVVRDGVEYLEPQEPPASFWRTTDAGMSVLAEDQPLERVRALFDEDALYVPLYTRILEMCAADGGASTKALEGTIDNDPLAQSPRLYTAHFVKRLEDADAVEWRGAWQATETGCAALEELAKSGGDW